MTTLTATALPNEVPPSVLLSFSLDVPDATILDSEITRNGTAIYGGIDPGGAAGAVVDSVPPHNQGLTYQINGRYLPAVAPEWSETWTNLNSWNGDTGKFTASGGNARSSFTGAKITRSTSATIQKISIANPVNVKVSLLDSAGTVIVSMTSLAGSSVTTLTASPEVVAQGSGSYDLTMIGNVATLTGNGWSATSTYAGTPTRVQIEAQDPALYQYVFPASGSTISYVAYKGSDYYVASQNSITGLGQIIKYTSGIEVLRISAPSGVTKFSGVSADSAGNIYAAYTPNTSTYPTAVKYSSSGDLIWSANIYTPGTVHDVGSLVVDDTNSRLLVLAASSTEVIIESMSLTSGSTLSRYPLTPAFTVKPRGIAVDSTGNIYLPDQSTSSGSVRKYSSSAVATGTTYATVGALSLGVDSSNNVYTLSSNGVQKYANNGTLTSTLSNNTNETLLGVSGTGAYIVGDSGSFRLRSYTSAGVEDTKWRAYPALNFVDIATDTNGVVHALSASTVTRFSSTGAVLSSFNIQGGTGVSIALDSANNIYVGTLASNGRTYVWRYPVGSTGNSTVNWEVTTAILADLAFDSNDILYALITVANAGGNVLSKYTATGGPVSSIAITGVSARSIAVAKSGNLYVTIRTTTNVNSKFVLYELTPSGGVVNQVNPSYAWGNTIGVNLSGVALDALGNVYTSAESGLVYVLSATSNLSTTKTIPMGDEVRFLSVYGSRIVGGRTLASNPLRVASGVEARVGTVTASPEVTPQMFTAVSNTVTLDIAEAWMVHPSSPRLSMPVDFGACVGEGVFLQKQDQVTRGATATTHRLVGRAAPIVISSGNRSSEEFTLTFFAKDTPSIQKFTLLLEDQTPLYLEFPEDYGYDITPGWYSVGDVTIERSATFDMRIPARRFVLPMTLVDAPVVTVSALRSYGTVLLEAATYDQLSTLRPTYLDLLVGS